MREIEAYVRPERVEAVVVALHGAGAEPAAPELVEVTRRAAHTGHPGDGIIFVSGVDRAVKIRSGMEGREALA